MSRLEAVESEISKLSPEELKRFREWFLDFDASAWDRQLEEDVHSGKLDKLGEQALCDFESGRTTEL
jgi:hypothetical protein